MRTVNSAKNLASSLGISITITLLGFFTRKVFVDQVGVEYLGLNGLLQNILGIMTLLEGGFSTSVVYNLYKPVAEDDRPRILALLQLYRKVYRYIALGIVIFGVCLFPFIKFIIKDAENLEYVNIVYFIFLFNSVIGYFTAYRWSIINVSQQNYKLTVINLIYQIGLSISKLAILFYTHNYILYLVVESVFGVGLNLAIIYKSNKLFPYIKDSRVFEVEKETKNNIITNMKALFLNQLGGYFMHSTDNIIISAFVGVTSIGLYSNYTLIISTINSFVKKTLGSFSESVGNLIATESEEKIYNVFRVAFFINFLLVSIPLILIFNCIEPFISWWLGEEYLLGLSTLCVILLNFYVDMMRSTSLTFKLKSGIFINDRWTPLLQGIINIILSYIFVQFWGLTGVLFATAISIMSIGFWQFPRLCYKYVFHKPLIRYFKKYALYSIVGFTALLVSSYICRFIEVDNLIFKAIVNALISLLVILFIYVISFYRLEEFRMLQPYVKNIIKIRRT